MYELIAYPTTAIVTPLLGIYVDVDATIFIQFVIFWVMVGFLQVTVIRPYLDVVEAREEGIGGSKDDAAEMEARADQLEEEFKEMERQARREAQEVRQSLRNQGVQQQKQMFEEVRQEMQDKIGAERKRIDNRVDKARGKIEERAEELASTMVDKLVPQA